MLKIVYPNCCGIDVHKTFVLAVITITDEHGVTQYFRHRFSTFTKGLRELKQWLEYYSCTDVCIESTGKYWIADLFKHDLVAGSFIPPLPIRNYVI